MYERRINAGHWNVELSNKFGTYIVTLDLIT